MRSLLAASLLAATLAAGCAATVAADAYGPDLVTVSPGVQVIADYNEPIFYSDGFYWRYYGNTWYRSTYYTGGWVYAQPPVAVMRIDRPYAYRYYRPQGWVGHSHYNQPRTYGGPAPTAGYRGTPPPAYRGTPPAAYRGAPPAAAARRPPATYAPAPAYRGTPPAARPAQPAPRGAPPHNNSGWRGHP
jgi:hypothetical protein